MYCGIDIIEVERVKDAILNTKGFKEKIFSISEIKDIDKSIDKVKYQRYAGRFAAKEAVYKALSKLLVENNLVIEFSKIEIVNDNNLKRRPRVKILDNKICEILKDYTIDISISHIERIAMAECIVSRKD